MRKRRTITGNHYQYTQMADIGPVSMLVLSILLINNARVQGQCKILSNSTSVCMCHCAKNCRGGCQVCDLGWSGSKRNHCQKEHIMYQKLASQDNTYSELFNANKAVDGDIQTYSKVQERSTAVWWRVQLDRYHNITKINITMDTGANITYTVYVTDESLVTNTYSICNTLKVSQHQHRRNLMLECSRAILGTTIEIQAPPHMHLMIYEVDATSCANGSYGDECGRLCSPECHRACNEITGECDQCSAGYTGPSCASTCSRFCGRSGCDKTTGRCHQCANGLWGANCTKTCPKECYYHCQRETGLCKLCNRGHLFNNETCVECKAGFYGDRCSQLCSSNCRDRECNVVTGKCTHCVDGRHGEFCERNCSVNCKNFSCSALTGDCLLCEPGQHGAHCAVCESGYYGEQCVNICPYCKLGKCDPVNGTCFSCQKGKFGAFCENNCSSVCTDRLCHQNGECVSCPNGHYGGYCERLCPAVNCLNCDKTSGECLQCHTGRYGSDCRSICPDECRMECFINNGSCASQITQSQSPTDTHWMVNSIILAGTAVLIVASIGFLFKICRLNQERNQESQTPHGRPLTFRELSSSHQYQSLVEDHSYENINFEQVETGTEDMEPMSENACAAEKEFDVEMYSDLKPPERFTTLGSLNGELLRQQSERASVISTPCEAVVVRDDSLRVSYYKN
ncbi:multiple epidermal growth factor-like domains protein 10 isoform X2 [Ostrea edulis]|uniref:multiple epidermal growth factor-like domains protein 10 isoform X2 n=1 Tax=Ostrea edulis TaxID=37623 RepID=UPI0024AEFD93|nr:multiple epidermal growth factor-like domains protein 10 isoform X2 [Ostrea edulis]